jgi:hypothetical protein
MTLPDSARAYLEGDLVAEPTAATTPVTVMPYNLHPDPGPVARAAAARREKKMERWRCLWQTRRGKVAQAQPHAPRNLTKADSKLHW